MAGFGDGLGFDGCQLRFATDVFSLVASGELLNVVRHLVNFASFSDPTSKRHGRALQVHRVAATAPAYRLCRLHRLQLLLAGIRPLLRLCRLASDVVACAGKSFPVT